MQIIHIEIEDSEIDEGCIICIHRQKPSICRFAVTYRLWYFDKRIVKKDTNE